MEPIIFFWNAANTITMGTSDTSEAANARGTYSICPPAPFKSFTSKGSVFQFTSPMKSMGPRKSFQFPMNDRIPCVASAGMMSGRIIEINVRV